MRALALTALCIVGCDVDALAPPAAPPKPALETATAVAKRQKDCRDSCEQSQILVGGKDVDLRACRARCDGQAAAATGPRELPRSIRVAPVHHVPPAVRPR